MSRVLIIGLDGATFDLIKPWVESGRLPNMSRLLRDGVSGKLRSTIPPMSPAAWNSFMTGKNPGKHGIFDFTERKPQSYEARFINAGWRKTPAFWHALSEAGKRVAVLSVPFTYPPEKVNGVMVSGMDAPGVAGLVERSATYPPELCDEIRSRVGDYPMGPNFFAYTDPREMVEAAVRTIEKKTAAALYLYQREPWDCFLFVLGETDGASHRFWRFCDPASPLKNGLAPDRGLSGGMLRVYQKADEAIGRFLDVASEDTSVIVMSDHGNGGNGDKAVYLNRWLENERLLRFKAGNGFVSAVLEWAKRFGLRVIPPRIKQMLYRLTSLPNTVESWVRFSAVDWRQSRAYSEETPYFPSIWINLKGREPLGVVEPGDYASTCDQVKAALEQWRDPYTGQKMVKRVFRREDLYSGPYVDRAPDLTIEWNLDGEYSYVFRPSTGRKRPPVCKLDPAEMKTVKSGDHRDHGIFIAAGPDLKTTTEISGAEIIDLAPTILYLSGLPVPTDVDGRVLGEIFQDGHLAAHPVRHVDAGASEVEPIATPRGFSGEEEEAVKARLQGLGYIE